MKNLDTVVQDPGSDMGQCMSDHLQLTRVVSLSGVVGLPLILPGYHESKHGAGMRGSHNKCGLGTVSDPGLLFADYGTGPGSLTRSQ